MLSCTYIDMLKMNLEYKYLYMSDKYIKYE